MKTARAKQPDPDLRDEYDFSGGVRGKYAARFAKGSLVVVLDPDLARRFPTAEKVNEALRALVEVADTRARKRRVRATSS